MPNDLLRVFVSSTSRDLTHHRQAAQEVIRKQRWHPVMMEDFGTSPETTVEACRQKVRGCDLVLLLVAFRRGWVPRVDQGGDGRSSVTAFELEEARNQGIPVRILLARESWPGNLWENDDQNARDWMRAFRDQLNQIADFFEAEFPGGGREPMPGEHFRQTVRQALQDHWDWLLQPARVAPAPTPGRRPVGAETVLVALEPLLAGLPLTRRESTLLYQRCRPVGWEAAVPSALHPGTFLVECARDLAQAPRQGANGTFPLLTFVRAIVDLVSPERAAPLQVWWEQATERLIGRPTDALPPPTLEQKPDGETSHLLVQLSRPTQQTASDSYRVKAWLVGEPCLLPGEEEYPLSALPGLLDGLRLQLARRGVPFDRLWVEFVLPHELLGTDVDQWMVQVDMFDPLPIGSEHRVVVRSLNRMQQELSLHALRGRWGAVRRHSTVACRVDAVPLQAQPDTPVLCLAGTGSGRALLARLRGQPSVVCAVLEPPPPGVSPNGVVAALLAAGIPVILWARQESKPPESRPLSQLIHDSALGALPDRVWCLRREAVEREDAAHPGCHLTLVWDDPGRVSPDFDPANQLRTPQQER